MSVDVTLALHDRRMNPPEPDDWDYRPGYEAERAYYEGEDGHECPVCKTPKPGSRLGCWLCGPDEPSYKMSSWDFNDDYDKDDRP